MFVERNVFLVTLLVASVASISVLENEPSNATQPLESREHMMARYRLPNNTIPRLYRITIEPNMTDQNLTWSGKSSIDFQLLEVTKIITVHAYENLKILTNFTVLVHANGTEYKPIDQRRDNELEFLMVEFEREIAIGNYSLNLKYEGANWGSIVGFYKASYPSTDVPAVAATHFEATRARRAFPCWDEPGLKARYRMSIKHHRNYTTVSNMPEIERVETPDGKILTTFDTTPIMSIYLLSFAITDYENITNEHGNVTIWASKDILNEVRHVLNTSQKVVDFMEAYTGLPYGLPRIGSILIPVYSSAATEHWGLVSYNEAAMRFDPTTDTTKQLDSINLLIAHELSHSWFGNRVSPLWWNDLWLNEGFATYFKYFIMDEIHENWKGLELFVMQNNWLQSFTIDVYESSISIRWTPTTNSEIRYLFGRTTYQKGAAIIHMFRNVLGDDVFRAGLKKYLTKYSYQAVETSDLTRALQEAYDENGDSKISLDVEETMMSWLTQVGHPMINVTRNYTTGVTRITQQSTLIAEHSPTNWWIPLNYATRTDLNFSSTVPSIWLNDREDSLTIDGIDKDDWVIFNVRASGYYRVNYDEKNWKRLVEYLNSENYKNIHVLNRAQLINDVSFFSMKEPLRFRKLLFQLTNYLSREDHYLPWYVAQFHMRFDDDLLSGTEIHETFQKYVMNLMGKLIEKVGYETFDDDDHLTKLSKEDIVTWACISGHSGCAEFSAPRLLRLIENPEENRLHSDNELAIVCAGLRGLNDTAIKPVVEWLRVNKVHLFIKALGCTENHEIHRNILRGTSEFHPLPIDVVITGYFNIMAGSEENFNFAVDFLIEQLQDNETRSHDWHDSIDMTSSRIFSFVRTKARLNKFKQLLEVDAMKTENVSPDLILDAKRRVEESDEFVSKYRLLLQTIISSDNTISKTSNELS